MSSHASGRRGAGLGLGLALVLLAACSKQEPRGVGAGGVPRRGGTVVVAVGAEPKTLMPYAPMATGAPGSYILGTIFSFIATTDSDLVGFSPGLARSWEWSADGRALTFHLRDDVRWSDGVPLTAEDVRFTFEVARDSVVGWPTRAWKKDILACEVLDPQTVRYRFATVPREAFRFAKEGFVVPQHLLAGVPRAHWSEAEYGRAPVGSGPFRLASWEPQQRLVLVRNEYYFEKDRPYLDRIVFQIVPDASQRVRLLRAGQVDFVDELPSREAREMRAEVGPVRIVHCQGRDYDFIAYNLRDPLFASPRVREALTRAMDREAIIHSLCSGFARPLAGPVVPLSWACDPQLEPLPFDPPGARRLLAAEGWQDADADGWLERDGQRFEFTLATTADNELRRDVSVPVQSQWKAIGIRAEVRVAERAALRDQRERGDFQALLGGWSTNLALDLRPVWGCGAGRYNFVGYCNPRVDSLNAAALQLPYAQAKPLLYAAQRQVARDQPYTFLYALDLIVGTSERLQGVIVDRRGAFNNPEEWWVRDGAPGR